MPRKPARYSKKPKAKTTMKKPNTKPTKKLVQKMVKTEIAKNIENKVSDNISTQDYIISTNASAVPTYFNWSPSSNGLFQINQGVSNNERIGNKIKIKRWVIKGVVCPLFLTATTLGGGQGYVNLYLVRRNDFNPITGTLPDFYQDGNSSETPDGTLMQAFKAVNKDVYKVYWRKQYKVGQSTTVTGGGANVSFNNNDFSLVKRFGLDVCKYVCKNRILKWDDTSTDCTDPIVDSLALVATFQSASQDMTFVASENTFYQVAVNSYFEYEDA